MVLFIKHISIEGPGTLGQFFEENGFESRTIELYDRAALPGDLDSLDAVISLGGPMNVYEESKHPFLATEDAFLKKIMDRQIPMLGICLGSQLLAKACGAKVERSPEKEVGFFPVRLTDEGKRDPLFSGLDSCFDVFQWHEDMVQVPAGGRLLASSSSCPHQAFKVGDAAYGLQFHVEVTEPVISAWADAYFSPDDFSLMKQKERMLKDYSRKQKKFRQTAEKIYENFLGIISRRSAKGLR